MALVAAGSEVAAEVDDRGNGTYALRFVVTAAGPFQLTLASPPDPGPGRPASAGAARPAFRGVCRPARAAAQACTVEAADADVAAGARGRIRVARADRFGNPVASGAGQPAVLAAWQGPGPVECAVSELRGGCVEVAFAAKAAGAYTVALQCRDQELLVGSAPVEVHVRAGAAAGSACRAVLAGAAAGGSVPVGVAATVTVDVRDAHGNAAADLNGQAVAVEAAGPAALAFVAAGEDGARHAAVAVVAGEYVVAVRTPDMLSTDRLVQALALASH